MIFKVHIMFDAKSNQLWSIVYNKCGILIQIERWRNQIPKLKDTIKSIKVQCDDRFLSLSKPELLLWFTEWWKICYDYEINANPLRQQIFRHHVVIWQFLICAVVFIVFTCLSRDLCGESYDHDLNTTQNIHGKDQPWNVIFAFIATTLR